MKHLNTIEALIRTLIKSIKFHALVVESMPGWGKSTALDLALSKCGIEAISAGAYATPLHIFNTMSRSPTSVLIFDDVAAIFSDPKTMAILKAATWQQSGGGGGAVANGVAQKPRRVSWGSTSEKVERASIDFSGKIILLTNTIPSGKETEAFLSRCLSFRIRMQQDDIKVMLLDAARSETYFPKTELALEVACFLVDNSHRFDLMKMSLRTLTMGYDLAETNSDSWKELLGDILPSRKACLMTEEAELSQGTDELIKVGDILRSNLCAKEQETRFVALTGKSRRTFYNYKKQLGLTRPYQPQPSKTCVE